MKKKSLKVKQQQEPEPEPEPESTLTQTPLPDSTTKTFRKILFYPSFKVSFPYDLQLAHKRNIHFKRTRLTENFNSNSYKRLIKRNLKYIRRSELCTFGSRPSLSLLQEVNQQERNQQTFPMIAGKPQGNVRLGLFGFNPMSQTDEKDLICLFQFLRWNNIFMQSLKSFCYFIQKKQYQRKFLDYLTGASSLRLVYNSFFEWRKNGLPIPMRTTEYPDLELDPIYNQGLVSFGKLKEISLDFTRSDSKNTHSQAFFCDVIKMLSQIPSLKAIEITMTISEVEKKVQKLKAFTEKLTQLKSLKLNFNFMWDFSSKTSETGRIFTTILPLPTLKHLSVNFLPQTRMTINCSDLADFISSMKNIESLEFTVPRLCFDEYVRVFEAISKLKLLTKLSVVQTGRHDYSFAFGILFKMLNALKKLTSIKIDLGSKFDDNEINSYPQHLLKHPTLKRAKIVFQVSPQGCNLKDEFFANIHRLRDKLDKLNLTLVYFPVEAQKAIKKIIVRNKTDLKHFNCQSAEIPGYYGIGVAHFNEADEDNNDGDEEFNVNDEI